MPPVDGETETVEVADPPADIVTEDGDAVHVAPEGQAVNVSDTVPEK